MQGNNIARVAMAERLSNDSRLDLFSDDDRDLTRIPTTKTGIARKRTLLALMTRSLTEQRCRSRIGYNPYLFRREEEAAE